MFKKAIENIKKILQTGPTKTPLDVLQPSDEELDALMRTGAVSFIDTEDEATVPEWWKDINWDDVDRKAEQLHRQYRCDWVDCIHDHVGEEDDG